ncbi:hypothetical protein CH371_06750 [Leptospira wolffii]|uniref:Uncharacterized protein n=1 Tax=Leptospira wolffii TaxID=409998 RepID=A0A2M9ZGZ1_9LEPT|nr:hypothetical protein [Leptospira wolffii]PJZ67693.1 hypothetical protein CH371_06750 [Leptospira wolffii]
MFAFPKISKIERHANAIVIGAEPSCLLSSYLLAIHGIPVLLLSERHSKPRKEEHILFDDKDLFVFEGLFRSITRSPETIRRLSCEDLEHIYFKLQDPELFQNQKSVCRISEDSLHAVIEKEISVMDNISRMYPTFLGTFTDTEDTIRMEIGFGNTCFVVRTDLVFDTRFETLRSDNFHSLFTSLYERIRKITRKKVHDRYFENRILSPPSVNTFREMQNEIIP